MAKVCKKGYSCGGSCISVTYMCRKEFSEGVSVSIDGARKVIKTVLPPAVTEDPFGMDLDDIFGDVQVDTLDQVLQDVDSYSHVIPLSEMETLRETTKWAQERGLTPFVGQTGQQHDVAHLIIQRMIGVSSERWANITQLKDSNAMFSDKGPGLFEEALVLSFEQRIYKMMRDTGKFDSKKAFDVFESFVNNLGGQVATGMNFNYKQDALASGKRVIDSIGKNPYLKDYVKLYGDLIYEGENIFD